MLAPMVQDQSVGKLVRNRIDIVGITVRVGASDPRSPHGTSRPLSGNPQGNIDRVNAGIDQNNCHPRRRH